MNKERKIIVDIRENKLISLLSNNINISTTNLAVGDIVFSNSNNDNVDLIIERKAYPDIYASIIDGRLHDQKQRIQSVVSDKKKVLYLFEGNFDQRILKKKKHIYGAISNIMLSNEISTFRTINIEETAEFIIDLGNRFLENKKPFNNELRENKLTNFGSLKKKNEILDPKICFHYQLCQIPMISNSKAEAITEKWNSIMEFIIDLKKNENPLNLIENIKLKNGKKMGKKTAEKLLFFLGHIS